MRGSQRETRTYKHAYSIPSTQKCPLATLQAPQVAALPPPRSYHHEAKHSARIDRHTLHIPDPFIARLTCDLSLTTTTNILAILSRWYIALLRLLHRLHHHRSLLLIFSTATTTTTCLSTCFLNTLHLLLISIVSIFSRCYCIWPLLACLLLCLPPDSTRFRRRAGPRAGAPSSTRSAACVRTAPATCSARAGSRARGG